MARLYSLNKYGFRKDDKSKKYVDEYGNTGWVDIPCYDKTHTISLYCESIDRQINPAIKGEIHIKLNSENCDPEIRLFLGTGADLETQTFYSTKAEGYAMFDNSLSKLIFFRDATNSYTSNQTIGSKTYYTGIETQEYTANTIPWKDKQSLITSVEFRDGIFPISTAYWFNNLINLTSIKYINRLDTYKTTNMSYMFNNCSNLSSIDLSYINTSNVTTMDHMFSGCTNLSRLNIECFDFRKVTDITSFVERCENAVISIVFNNIPESIDNAFDYCGTSIESSVSIYETNSRVGAASITQWYVDNIIYSGIKNISETKHECINVVIPNNVLFKLMLRPGNVLIIKNIPTYCKYLIEGVSTSTIENYYTIFSIGSERMRGDMFFNYRQYSFPTKIEDYVSKDLNIYYELYDKNRSEELDSE